MMASSFGKPLRSGSRTCRSGLPPATQAAAGERQPRRASVRDQAPLGSGERGQTRANRVRELVQVHVLPCRRVHRRAHLRQHRRTADDGEGAAGVDERADADRRVDVGTGLAAQLRRAAAEGAGSLALAEDGGGYRQQTAQHTPSTDQFAPADGLAHRSVLLGSCVTMPHGRRVVKDPRPRLSVTGQRRHHDDHDGTMHTMDNFRDSSCPSSHRGHPDKPSIMRA